MMITLNLSPNQQAIIEHNSRQAGMSVQDYLINLAIPKTKHMTELGNTPKINTSTTEKSTAKTLADIVTGKKLQGFQGDPVAIQRAMRNEWQ